MNLVERWNRYWFREAPLLDLGMMRLYAVGLQVVLLAFDSRYDKAGLSVFDAVPDYLYHPVHIYGMGLSLIGDPRFSLDQMQMVHTLTLIAGVAALFGIFTVFAMPIFAFGCTFIQFWIVSQGDIHHPEAAMIIALWLLAFSPCGGAVSVDAIRKRRGIEKREEQLVATSRQAKWPILTLQWFFALMYLSACYAKLVVGDLHWANGYTLQFYLAQDGLRWNSLLGTWMSQFHLLSLAGQWFILFFQGTFAISIIFPKLKWFYVPVGMAMHVGIYFMFKAPFFQWMALYLVFIPWTAVLARLKLLPASRADATTLARASAG